MSGAAGRKRVAEGKVRQHLLHILSLHKYSFVEYMFFRLMHITMFFRQCIITFLRAYSFVQCIIYIFFGVNSCCMIKSLRA